jgi:uroporphyrinogen III methyltransferase/synthase
MPDTLNTLKLITRNGALELKQVSKVFDHFPDLQYKLVAGPSEGFKYDENRLNEIAYPKHHPKDADKTLLEGNADLIIQSLDDLPYPLPTGLAVIALFEPAKERNEHLVIVGLANRPELKSLFATHDIRNQFGKITLVGFGPGNPDLLTLGGDKALAQSDIIFHDDLLDKDYLKKYAADKVYVGKRKGSHCFEQGEINHLILEAAKAGKQVVRLKGGDPMIFAHGGEEVEYLERNLVEVEVIPGVSSGIAVASLLKVPLTHRGISTSMAFISGHTEKVHLPDADTLVIYMGGSNIRAIARKVIEQGRNPQIPVMMVYNLSLPDQQEFFFTLKEISLTEQKFPTPIIIVIGEVVSFRNKQTTELLKNNIQDSVSNNIYVNELGKRLEKIKSFDWLIFTNRQSVGFFFETLENNGRDSRFLAGINIAASGKNTQAALKEHGIVADINSESSQELISGMKDAGIIPSKGLIPYSIQQSSALQQSLNELGWKVSQLIPDQHVARKNLIPVVSSMGKATLPRASIHQTPYVDKVTIE